MAGVTHIGSKKENEYVLWKREGHENKKLNMGNSRRRSPPPYPIIIAVGRTS